MRAAGGSVDDVARWAAALQLQVGALAWKAQKALETPPCQASAQQYAQTSWKGLMSDKQVAEIDAAAWAQSKNAGQAAEAKTLAERAITGYRRACEDAVTHQEWLLQKCPQIRNAR